MLADDLDGGWIAEAITVLAPLKLAFPFRVCDFAVPLALSAVDRADQPCDLLRVAHHAVDQLDTFVVKLEQSTGDVGRHDVTLHHDVAFRGPNGHVLHVQRPRERAIHGPRTVLWSVLPLGADHPALDLVGVIEPVVNPAGRAVNLDAVRFEFVGGTVPIQ